VHEALAEPEVLAALGLDVGHAPPIAADQDRAGDALDLKRTGGLGQRAAQQAPVEGGRGER
jgi:hypothetical protein